MLATLECNEQLVNDQPSTVRCPDLQGRAVTVVGMGKSGLAAARLLCTVQAKVTIVDQQERDALEQPISLLA